MSFSKVMARSMTGMAAALCLLASVGLTGCRQEPSPSDASNVSGSAEEKVTLKVGLLESGYGRDWFDYATERFTKLHPNVKFDVVASPQIEELIGTRAAAGNDEEMFDIFYGATWAEYVNANKLEPVTDIYDIAMEDAGGKKLNDVVVQGFNDPSTYYQGEKWVFPLVYYVGGMFYDQTFFAEKGWNTHPATYDEFLKLCQTIKDSGIDPIVIAGLPNYGTFAFNAKTFELADEQGDTEFRKNYMTFTGPQFTSKESLEVYNRQYELGQKGYISKQSVGMSHTQSQMLVLQHKAAMCPSGDWIEGEMADSTPEGFKWGYMNIPFANDGKTPNYISGGVSMSFEMWANKPEINKKWSKEFLASLLTLEVQEQLVSKGANPMRADYTEDAARADKMGNMQKSIAKYMAENNVVFELGETTVKLTDPDHAKALKVIVDNNAMVYTGQKKPDEMLQEAEKLIQGAIARDKEKQGIK